MPIAKERAVADAFLPPWVRSEHHCRYEFGGSFVAGRTVADCACGDGTGSRRFAAAGAARVLALDLSLDALTAARGGGGPVAVAAADATSLPLAAGSVDVFISLETIEHLEDAERFLAEVRRVLGAGGQFVCSTPDRTVYNPGRGLHSRPWNPFHVREYSRPEFTELLGRYFDSIEMFGQNPKRPLAVRAWTRLARLLPGHGAVRLGQLLKLPRFVLRARRRHRVVPCAPGRFYEYLVAVCR